MSKLKPGVVEINIGHENGHCGHITALYINGKQFRQIKTMPFILRIEDEMISIEGCLMGQALAGLIDGTGD